jgi:hypothetical protein
MVNAPSASVIVAVVSLVGAVGAATLVAYTTLWSDSRKRRSEAVAILNKYQDPLLLAAFTLRQKIQGILNEAGSMAFQPPNPSGARGYSVTEDYFILHTAFLVGQFFAWVYILRLESQFLSIQRSHKTRALTDAFFSIEEAWTEDGDRYMLWRGQQSGIGELMTVTDNGQRSCMGYAAFRHLWYTDPQFKQWFGDFGRLPRPVGGRVRLEKVSHGLEALIEGLDPKGNLMAVYSKTDEGAEKRDSAVHVPDPYLYNNAQQNVTRYAPHSRYKTTT